MELEFSTEETPGARGEQPATVHVGYLRRCALGGASQQPACKVSSSAVQLIRCVRLPAVMHVLPWFLTCYSPPPPLQLRGHGPGPGRVPVGLHLRAAAAGRPVGSASVAAADAHLPGKGAWVGQRLCASPLGGADVVGTW